MTNYIGIIHKDIDSQYGMCFPDFPGCISAGANLIELFESSRDALEVHIELLNLHDQKIPDPSNFTDVISHEFSHNSILYASIKIRVGTDGGT